MCQARRLARCLRSLRTSLECGVDSAGKLNVRSAEDVSVYAEGGLERRVPEPPLHTLHVGTPLYEDRGRQVAEVVDAYRPHLCPSARFAEPLAQVAALRVVARQSQEDEALAWPIVADALPVFSLLLSLA